MPPPPPIKAGWCKTEILDKKKIDEEINRIQDQFFDFE